MLLTEYGFRSEQMTGLDSLIYLNKALATKVSVQGASAGDQWTRWLPMLDDGMHNAAQVQALFGRSSALLCDMLKESLKAIVVCIVCHERTEGFSRPVRHAVLLHATAVWRKRLGLSIVELRRAPTS